MEILRSKVATAIIITDGSFCQIRAWRGIKCAVTCLIRSDKFLLQFYVARGYRGNLNHMRLTNRCLAQVFHMHLTGNMCLITMDA